MINFNFMFDGNREDFKEILGELRGGKARPIDIREESEWKQNRFKCATHIPLSNLLKGVGIYVMREIRASNQKIYLHCRSGNRTRKAQEILAQYGCTDIHVILLTMMKMLEEGFILAE